MSHSLRREYAYYSWNHKFPDDIEQALEDDFVENRAMYTEITLKYVQAVLLILPDASPDEVLNFIRSAHDLMQTTNETVFPMPSGPET